MVEMAITLPKNILALYIAIVNGAEREVWKSVYFSTLPSTPPNMVPLPLKTTNRFLPISWRLHCTALAWGVILYPHATCPVLPYTGVFLVILFLRNKNGVFLKFFIIFGTSWLTRYGFISVEYSYHRDG